MNDSAITYHLRELAIAEDPASPAYAMPELSPDDTAILDVGCGVGQAFVASRPGRQTRLVGLDLDHESLAYGHRRFGHIAFVCGAAERLPLGAGVFDLVMSRVSLPYTDIPLALREAERVLKDGGRVWFSLHPPSMVAGHLLRSLARLALKDAAYRSWVIVNGVVFALSGRVLPLPSKGTFESFQTASAMTRAMRRAGFTDIWVGKRGRHLICTARKRR